MKNTAIIDISKDEAKAESLLEKYAKNERSYLKTLKYGSCIGAIAGFLLLGSIGYLLNIGYPREVLSKVIGSSLAGFCLGGAIGLIPGVILRWILRH